MSEFSDIARKADDLPTWVRENSGLAYDIESHRLDKSYLAFLDEQIAFLPRGPEWTRVLKKRREVLSEFCGKSLTSGIVSSGKKHCSIKIDNQSERIVYWEIFDTN